jgi:formyl-CoA transferase/CoA:oxalate CoA-transferase
MWAALGVLAALSAGGGHTVDVSLFETAIGLLPYQVTAYLSGGGAPGRYGSAFPLISPYQVFQARDGEVMIAAANDGLFRRLCAALGLDGVAEDIRFATNPDRIARREELAALIQERLRGELLEDVLADLAAAGVPAAPVNDVGQAAGHEQTAALGLIQDLPRPTVALPLSIDGERVVHRSAPPRLGEHTDEVLRTIGYTEAELETLAANGVIRRVESSG